ncbi:MAG: PadR family transcriptional regulator, partial [Acidobacteriota bacterium]
KAGVPSAREMQLLALVVVERSGLEVADLFKRETGNSISPGSLYTTFRRLREAGWVKARSDEDEDGRVRYFKLTGTGVEVLNAARAHYARLARFGLTEEA